MYSKGKNLQLSSDMQAKEKLSVYVYEYLVHCGAKNTAQSFLNETRLDKNLQLTESPGFLLSWWSVFWDLYCAAPERREGLDSTNEAKAYLDLNMSGGNPIPPNQENIQSPGIMPHNQNYFNVPPNHQPNMMPGPQFNRYQAGSRSGPNSNAPPGPNQMNMDPGRMNPSMSPMNRLTPPANARGGPPPPPQGQMMNQQMGGNNYNGPPPPGPNQGMPPGQINRGGGGQPNSHMNQQPMSPMPMHQQPQQQPQRWMNPGNQMNPSNNQQSQVQQQQMNYSSPSPAPYNVSMAPSGGGPTTPNIIPQSPQHEGENFNMMKNVPSGMQYHEPNMGHMVPMNSEIPNHMNGELMDSMKNSPIQNMPNNGNGNGVPRHHEEQHHSNANMNELNYNFAENIF